MKLFEVTEIEYEDFDSETNIQAAKQVIANERLAWNFGVPLLVAVIPGILFRLMGMVGSTMLKPNAEPPAWAITLMIVFQILGMVAMAVVFLIRWDYSFRKLATLTSGRPHIVRRLLLYLSFVCLLLFDILFNFGAAFAGSFDIAIVLWLGSVPIFTGFVLCYKIAFARLSF
ncbi:MAG: hypothetical protein ACK5PB_18180 [Pirellula sp.]|jgi:hypothetical protein